MYIFYQRCPSQLKFCRDDKKEKLTRRAQKLTEPRRAAPKKQTGPRRAQKLTTLRRHGHFCFILKMNFLLLDHELMLNHLLLVNQLLKKYDLIDRHNVVQEIMVYQVTFLQEYIHMTINQLNYLLNQ